MHIIDRSFYQRPTHQVARQLLGKLLVRVINGIACVGRICETEGYGGADDPASHAHRGKTARNSAMFGPVGHAYVYFIYGCHFCVNIVAKSSDQEAGAVLVRAVEPLQGIEVMQQLRGRVENIANGPGKLTQALGIDRIDDGHDLTQSGQLYIADDGYQVTPKAITTGPRIGIRVGTELNWRFSYG